MAERTTSRLGTSVLDLTVDDRSFKRGIRGVQNHTKHLHKAFDVAGVKAEKLSGRVGGLTKAFGGLAGAAGIGGVLVGLASLVQKSINNTIEMKVLAATAGVTTEAFQEYLYIGRQVGISQSGMIDGLKELKIRMDEFAQSGIGPGADAFLRLGYIQDDFQKGLITTDELFISVIEALRMVDDQAARLRIADEIFGGTGGEQFERLIRFLDEGATSMDDMRIEAHQLGVVLSDELVNKTRKTHIEFLQLKDVIATKLARAILDALPPAEDLAKLMDETIPKAVDEVVGAFQNVITFIGNLNLNMEKMARWLIITTSLWIGFKAAKTAAMIPKIGSTLSAPALVGFAGGAAQAMTDLIGKDMPWLAGFESSADTLDGAADKMVDAATTITKKDPYVPTRGPRLDTTPELEKLQGYISSPLEALRLTLEDYLLAGTVGAQKVYVQNLDGIESRIAEMAATNPVIAQKLEELRYAQTSFDFDVSGSYITATGASEPFADALTELNKIIESAITLEQQGTFQPRGLGGQLPDMWSSPAFLQFYKMVDDNLGEVINELDPRERNKLLQEIIRKVGPERIADAFSLIPTADTVGQQASILDFLNRALAFLSVPEAPVAESLTGEKLPGVEGPKDPGSFDDFNKKLQEAGGWLELLSQQSGGLVETFGTQEGVMRVLSDFIASGLNPVVLLMAVIGAALVDVFGGLWEVIGPLIQHILKPLSRILRALGLILGATIVPVYAVLAPILKLVEAAFIFLYNNVLIHVANGLIALANGLIWIANLIPGINIDYLDYLEPAEISTSDDKEGEDDFPLPGDEPGIPYDPEGPRVAGDADDKGKPAQFRQQRPINVTITFPGNVYAVGPGGFREFAQLIKAEFERLGVEGR